MITKALAKKLIDRLVMLPAQRAEEFGVTPQVIRNTIGYALERWARSDSHAERAVDAMCTSMQFRPTETDIRRVCSETPATLSDDFEHTVKCQACGGRGTVTAWRLVTYQGNSMKIVSSEPINAPRGYEDAMEVARRIADNPLPNAARQQVLSAAKECFCRKVTA